MFCSRCKKNLLPDNYRYKSCPDCRQKSKETRARNYEKIRQGEKERDSRRRGTKRHKEMKKKYRQSEAGKASQRRSYEKLRDSGYYRDRAKILSSDQKIVKSIRTRLYKILGGYAKRPRTKSLLGLHFVDFKVYLESKFKPGMTWSNYGLHGWHVDHIRPLCSFDLTDPKQLAQACHYTNLQPMWALDNLSKGGKYKR